MKTMKKIMTVCITALTLSTQAGTIGWGVLNTGIETFGHPVTVSLILQDFYDDFLEELQKNPTIPISTILSMDGILDTKAVEDTLGGVIHYVDNDALIAGSFAPIFVMFIVENQIVDSSLGTHLAIFAKLDVLPIVGNDKAEFDLWNSPPSVSWHGITPPGIVYFTPIPEPLTTGLALAGVALMMAQRRRK